MLAVDLAGRLDTALSGDAAGDLCTSVVEGLSILHPPESGHVFEVRIPVARGCTHAGYFNDLDRAAAAIEAAAKYERSIYATLNPVDPSLLARADNRILERAASLTTDELVVGRRRFLIDCDSKRPAGISATAGELRVALERRDHVAAWLAREHGWPEPAFVMSGNGGHAIYTLDVDVTAETDALIKNVLRALDARFSDDAVTIDTTVGNASRITKIPGTYARKGESTADRPHRRAEIEVVPDRFVPVTLSQLRAVAALAPTNGHRATTGTAGPRPPASDRDRNLKRARAYLASVPGAVEGNGGDQATYRVACVLARDFGLDRADALGVLRDYNGRCQPPWSERELEDKIDGAIKYGNGPIGSKANQDRPGWRGAVASASATSDRAGRLASSLELDLTRLTDAHAAELLAGSVADQIRHDQQETVWYSWQPPIWREDVAGARHRTVVELARTIARYALTLDDLDLRKRVLRFALALESRRGTDNVLELAKHRPPVAVVADVWDPDPWLLVTPTATIDLRTGEPRVALPADVCRHCTGAAYDPDAQAPRFRSFLDQIFAGDLAVIAYLQRLAGYCLTGDVREQVFLLLHGKGANGKSVLLSTLGFVLGSYSHVSPFKAFAQSYDKGGDVPSPELASLKGKRLIMASETREGTRLDEGTIKGLTGGEIVTARYLFGRYFSYTPEGKIFLAANHRPKVTDDSLAFWRRCHVLPFGQSFTGAAADQTLADQLRAEASGILNWAIAGCLDWQRVGLQPPGAVLVASASYRAANDALAGFLGDCTDPDTSDDDYTLGRDALAAYRQWADREGLSAKPADKERLGARAFGDRLEDKGFIRFHSRGGTAHRRLKLVTL